MVAKITKRTAKGITVEVSIPFGNSMLESEELIQESVNDVGKLATQENLLRFDSDGSPIQIAGIKLYSKKEKVQKEYETPYGNIAIERHLYQNALGGKTFCPLDKDARIIISSTPRFAKIISHKYTDAGSSRVLQDLEISNGRKVARSFIQNVADAVASIAQVKEEKWEYVSPPMEKPVKSITIGLDGTCMHLSKEGYRETMVGTIGFYNRQGERMHTIYVAATPEYGKETFMTRLEREIEKAKANYPRAFFIGIADGAKSNWGFLEKHTDVQVVDFWHATEYLGKAAAAIYSKKKQQQERKDWLDTNCHKLKHNVGSATRILNEMKDYYSTKTISAAAKEDLKSAITYFTNQKIRMKYVNNVENNIPIGSGVTEAACKVIVKQRLCQSGMKWKEKGASAVLSLRCLSYSTGRWNQFWNKIDQYGFPIGK